jgi:hypothetical protein
MTKNNAMKSEDLPRIEPYQRVEEQEEFQNLLEEISEEAVEELNNWYRRGLVISITKNFVLDNQDEVLTCSNCEEDTEDAVVAKITLDWMPTPHPEAVLCLDCTKNVHTEDVEPEIVMKNTIARELQEHPLVCKSTEEEIME